MVTLYEIHKEHTEFLSDIQFYIKEIDFLIKITTNETLTTNSKKELKHLYTYEIELNSFSSEFITLQKEILLYEKRIGSTYNSNGNELNKNEPSEEGIVKKYIHLTNKLKLIKESFYSFLTALHKSKANENKIF